MRPDDQHSVFRQLWNLALPIIGLNMLNVLTLAVDTAMCGRLPNAQVALTGLSFATQVLFLLMVAMIGLTVGTVAMISRAHGANDSARASHIATQSTLLTLLLTVCVSSLGHLVAPAILRLLGATDSSIGAALAYMRPLLTGLILYYLSILFGAVFRASKNTLTPFLVALFCNVLNVVLNYGLILGNLGLPALGVRGAAYGTLISQCVSVVALLLLIQRGRIPGIKLNLISPQLDWPLIKELFRVGWPAALDMVILNASFLSIVGMLGRIDELAVAAHGIGLRIQSIAFIPGLGVAQAAGAMIGQALGASKPERARQILRAAMKLTTAIMTTLSITIILLVFPITDLFAVPAGSPLQDYSVLWIRLLGYGMPIVAIHMAFVGLLQGAGATRTSLSINLAATFFFQIPLSYYLGFVAGFGVLGVWAPFPMSEGIKTLLDTLAYRKGDWAKSGIHV
jgi:putative MATE family efflux protein